MRHALARSAITLGFLLTPMVPALGAPADDVEAFESQVRPLLVEACLRCHGPDQPKGGLRVDSLASLVEGGNTGPAVVPGKPEESLLVEAVRRGGDLKMPPDKPLTPTQVAALERWVAAGAPWPTSESTSVAKRPTWRDHWAFRPVADPAPPALADPRRARNPVDAFVLARLDANGLAPSPTADRRTLIRRVTYDLTGLPPSPEDVEAFVNDPAPDAYERRVDRLLGSPAYGERWARHWLDVARYADTKGYVYGREERHFVHAPAYRDWVVRAFNADLPYDRFLVDQIAADVAEPGQPEAQAAMGFLTLGRRFLGVTHDIIDDRIDVVTRGTMALTVSCARCHDHKFDPIPTADYYALYGVFRNSTERLVPASREQPEAAFAAGLAAQQEALRVGMLASRDEASRRVRARLADYLMAQKALASFPQEGFDVVLAPDDLNPASVRRWRDFLAASAKADEPTFRPWRQFAALADADFSARSAEVTKGLADKTLPARVAAAFATSPANLREVADRYARLFAEAEAPSADDPEATDLRRFLREESSPCVVPDEPIVSSEWFFDTENVNKLWALQGEVERYLIASPQAPPYALAMVDRREIREPRIFRRGSPANPGDEVPRRFLAALSGPDRKPFAQGSGRLDLAQAIADPANPLTARVWVNRVWQHHFGAGLVRTASDFGLRSEPPSHPELLDWLARRLVESGWSTKVLHRLIVLSATYQQTSGTSTERATSVDPSNRLLWRMNPRRLDFEEARDTWLAVTGRLDRKAAGRGGDLFAGDGSSRRTLYAAVDRQFLPGAFRTFDFASPDLHAPARGETTVPQQALFAMNHPFLAQRARALATAHAGPDVESSVRSLYRALYQREPTAAQLAAARAFVDASPDEPATVAPAETLAWSYGYGTLEDSAGRVGSFQPLPHFNGMAWGGGPDWPDPSLGWTRLTAEGGHPGADLQHATIRRWTAPADAPAVVSVRSTVTHEPAEGNGIRCRVISSRLGVLKTVEVRNGKAELNVEGIAIQPGDTLDFVTDFLGELTSDQNLWAPRIVVPDSESPRWDAARDFAGPPSPTLSPWEQLAQVLLMANELMFLD